MTTQNVNGIPAVRRATAATAESAIEQAARLAQTVLDAGRARTADATNFEIAARASDQRHIDEITAHTDELQQLQYIVGGDIPAATAPAPQPAPVAPVVPTDPAPAAPAPQPAPVAPAPADATTQVLVQQPAATPPAVVVTEQRTVYLHWYDLHRFGWVLIALGGLAGLIIGFVTWDLFMSMIVNDFIGTALNAKGTAFGLTLAWLFGWPLFGAGFVGWLLYRHTYPRNDAVALVAYRTAVGQFRTTHVANQVVVVNVTNPAQPQAEPVPQAQPAQPVVPAAPTA